MTKEHMNKREALKIAYDETWSAGSEYPIPSFDDVVLFADKLEAIREALEQPDQEQEPVATWVGLTNNDLQPIADEYRILFGSWVHDFARAIEAKLKEKNT